VAKTLPPLPRDRVEIVLDGVGRRAWVQPATQEPFDILEVAVAAPAGTSIPAPSECWAVYPSADGAAWACALQVLGIEGNRLTVRASRARRVQRRAFARQPVGWAADLTVAPDVDDEDDDVPPQLGPGRGHLRVVVSRSGPSPVAARWREATCVDLSAGGARLELGDRFDAAPGTRVAVRIAVPELGRPVLPAELVAVVPTRRGGTSLRVSFALPSRAVVDELATVVLREQLAERRRAHDPHAPAR
jgi:hypothetical protein